MKVLNFFVLLVAFLITTTSVFSQEIAITERGDSIVVYSNGTWDYYNNFVNDTGEEEEIRTNPNSFQKPKSSTKKVNGLNNAYQVFYNDKKWKVIPAGKINPDADIALQFTNGDAYAMVIYEQLEIPVETLAQVALDNAILFAPDMKLVDKEYRVVNDETLIWMRMDGSTQGMKISYYSYYYSNANGSIQFHTFTGQNLIDKYKEEVESLLNGLIIEE